jgi:actin-related protein 2
MVEFSTDGLGTMVFEAIRGSDATVRAQLYKNILLSGGTTMLPGFPDRLKADTINSWKTFVRRNPQTDVKAPVEIIVSIA